MSHHPQPRLHALDGLRATMMLLGLVIHAVISYGVVDYGGAWSRSKIPTGNETVAWNL